MNEPQVYKTPEIQYDNEGFVKSFDLDTASSEQLSEFYHEYGFIIFKNILTQEQIQKTVDDLWSNTIEFFKIVRGVDIDRNNPKTWNELVGFQRKFGFVSDSILEEQQVWQNRKNPKVYKSFKRVYEAYLRQPLTQPLLACFDRGSLMLPSKLNPEWRSRDLYHFDIDPWVWTGKVNNFHKKYDYNPHKYNMLMGEGNYDPYVGYTKLAGVLALSDTNQTSGGFSCAAGFQNYIEKWCEINQDDTRITSDKNLVENFRKIFMKKGSLLVFSRQLPHNIYQNDSENFRYAQYLRMSPLSALCLTPKLIEARKKLVKMILPKTLDVSDEISKQIFMLNEEEENQIHKKNEQIQLNEAQSNQFKY